MVIDDEIAALEVSENFMMKCAVKTCKIYLGEQGPDWKDTFGLFRNKHSDRLARPQVQVVKTATAMKMDECFMAHYDHVHLLIALRDRGTNTKAQMSKYKIEA